MGVDNGVKVIILKCTSNANGSGEMAKLTKNQKNLIDVMAMYYAMAKKELEFNGVTAEYDRYTWMYVYQRDQLGLEVLPYQRAAADRFLASQEKAVA